MPPAHSNRGSWSIRTAAAAVVLLIVAAPAFSYTWLGPFPDVPVPVVPNPAPTVDESVPPIFTWTDTPPTDVVIEAGPPTGGDTPKGAPEPATVVTGLIGAGALGLIGLWRKRRSQSAP